VVSLRDQGHLCRQRYEELFGDRAGRNPGSQSEAEWLNSAPSSRSGPTAASTPTGVVRSNEGAEAFIPAPDVTPQCAGDTVFMGVYVMQLVLGEECVECKDR
jgi:hypothetical protein